MNKRWSGLLAAAVVAFGVTACEPPPPRLEIVVDSLGTGYDDDPGDGVCSSAESPGSCTLEATYRLGLSPESPLVDAIPLGGPACDPSSVDVYGNARGVDGDGDGIAGCDIGAIELQPAP